MTTPPLPASPCVRVRLDYKNSAGPDLGSRFYLSYSGSAPSGSDCNTLATDIGNAWGTHISPVVDTIYELAEVDVLDIASYSGASGLANPGTSGANAGTSIPANVALNVEFDIARRYRGGKPRMFFPPPPASALADSTTWTTSTITSFDTAVSAFFSEIAGLVVGSMGTLAHVNLSFYQGVYTTTPPWRGPGYKYPPKYRASALLDNVLSYATKPTVGSQRRRRTSSTY